MKDGEPWEQSTGTEQYRHLTQNYPYYCVVLKVLAVYMLTLRTYLCLLIKYLYLEYGRYIIQYICICLGPWSQNTFVLMKESCVKSCMSPWVLSFWLQPLVKPPLLRPETSASRKSLLAIVVVVLSVMRFHESFVSFPPVLECDQL